jgi:surface protein
MFAGAENFNGDLSNWNTQNVTNMSEMFAFAENFNGDLSNWNTQNVTNMSFMFRDASNFNGDLSNWNTQNVTNMSSMFNGASNFNGDLSNWNTQNVTTMGAMFAFADNFNGDLSNWNTQNVTKMSFMFNNASNFNGDLSNWNTQNVTNMSFMFAGAENFNGDLSNWNTQNVTNMSRMFTGAENFNGDLSNWNTQNVTAMIGMFNNASNFNGDLSNWNTQNVTTMSSMFSGSGIDVFNYDQALIGWAGQAVKMNVNLGAQGLAYCLGEEARNTLMNTYNWNISGDQLDCSAYNQPPMAVCKNVMVDADANCQGQASAEDFNNGSSDPNMDELTFSVNPTGPYPIGMTTVVLTVEDPFGETSQCPATITVVDNLPPTPVCKTTTVEIQPNGTYTLLESDVYDAAASSDNCSIDMVSFASTTYDCTDEGQTFTVPVSVTDIGGNAAACNATITVAVGDALPSGWSASDVGNSGSPGNDSSFDPCSPNTTDGEFVITGGGNNATSSTTDNVAFSSQFLCGSNASITAKIESISAGGYGGLMMRETTAAGAKQVAIFSNLSSILRHEARYTTNGPKQVNAFFKPAPFWLRLQRQGDWIFAYYSNNGVSFSYVHGVFVPMNNCVEVGLASFTYNPGQQTTAVFSNVTVTGTPAPNAEVPGITEASQAKFQQGINLYPNPTRDIVNLTFEEGLSKDAIITLRNQLGQVVEQRELRAGDFTTEWNVSMLADGLYLFEIRQDGEAVQVLRLVKTN